MDITQSVTKTQDLPSEQSAGEIVAQGHERAKQLMDIVNQNQWAKNIQGKNYLQVEAWQTLGRFYNYTAITRETQYIEYDGVKGFDARVEILDKDGKVVGGAEASCMADEQNWRGKPLFSLKSMAQTRATGKAYRQILSWVAVLAGFEPTPAEEMDGVVIAPRQTSFVNNTQPARTDWKSGKITWKQSVAIEKFANGNPQKWIEIAKKNNVKTIAELTAGEASVVLNEIMAIWNADKPKVSYPSKYGRSEQIEEDFNRDMMERESL